MNSIPYCTRCHTAHDPIVEFKALVKLVPGDVIHMMGGSPNRRVMGVALDPQGNARIEWDDGRTWASDIPSPMSQQSLTEVIGDCRKDKK